MISNDLVRKSGVVKIRNGFSERNGLVSFNKIQQINEFDNDTRTMISNLLFDTISVLFADPCVCFVNGTNEAEEGNMFGKAVINDVCRQNNIRYDDDWYDWRMIYNTYIDSAIKGATFNEVLDVVEYVCNYLGDRLADEDERKELYDTFNHLFEKEYVGYRFVNRSLVQITDPVEVMEVNEACRNPYEGCRKQIQKAIERLSDRNSPDYKNSIKESISAVESICQIIVGDKKAILSDALKKLEDKGFSIHPALKQGFTKLYAYTSDEGGIRHAEGMFESNVTFDEAKYMLVSCSAFINYLISLYAKGNK